MTLCLVIPGLCPDLMIIVLSYSYTCRKKLEAQQPEFLRRKADSLEKIMNTERELGIEMTVTTEEVEECKRKADEIEDRLKKAQEEEEEEYLIFKPETVREDNIYIGR